MLTVAYDVLVKQLQKNLDIQDYYKNICTEVHVNGHQIQLLHPCFISDYGTEEMIFPEKAQTDIDKEFEPSIALCLIFSMKQDKQELELFHAMDDFQKFRESKDYGARMYAIDCGSDIQSAASICIAIMKNIFNADNVKSINIITTDLMSGEEICKRRVCAPRKAPVPVKIDGVATRVIDEQPTQDAAQISAPSVKVESKEGSLSDKAATDMVNDNKYRWTDWGVPVITLLFIAIVVTCIIKTTERIEPPYEMMNNNDEIVVSDTIAIEESNDDVVEKKTAVVTESETEIIGKWRETSSGSFNYIWLLEKNRSNGKYKVTVTYPGGVNMIYDCIRKKLKQNEYVFHDPYLDNTFTLKAGEQVYFIPNFDDGANAILMVIPNEVCRVYTNDIDNRYYELFSELQSIKY